MAGDLPRPPAALFGRLAVAVAVVTALDEDGRPHGATGMAWAEHGTPPLLLTTLRRAGRTRALVEAAGHFGVSILGESQRAYTRQFAAREAEPGARFDGVPFTPGQAYGVPLLDGCLASFECEVQHVYPFGGHDIVVARVERASGTGAGQPVIHYDGHLYGLREDGGPTADVSDHNPAAPSSLQHAPRLTN